MGKGYRQGRLGEEIRRIISQMLLSGIKDPRLSGMISISAVDVTSDGSYATCYVSILGSGENGNPTDEEKEQVLAGGIGSILGIVSGVLIFQVINYGMTFVGISPYMQYVIKGAIIIAAVAVDTQKYLKKV